MFYLAENPLTLIKCKSCSTIFYCAVKINGSCSRMSLNRGEKSRENYFAVNLLTFFCFEKKNKKKLSQTQTEIEKEKRQTAKLYKKKNQMQI